MKRLSHEALIEVADLYGVDFRELLDIKAGYRNVSHLLTGNNARYNIILHKAEPNAIERIKRTNAYTKYLNEMNLPVRYPIDDRLIRLNQQPGARLVGLYNFLPGQTIAWEAYSMKHIKLLGWALGDLHDASSRYTGDLPSVVAEYRAILGRMVQYFNRQEVVSAIRQKLGLSLPGDKWQKLAKLLDRIDALPTQALHMDFVRGNILFEKEMPGSYYQIDGLSISGIIDFEKASSGPPLMDISRTLAFLYVDCANKSQQKIFKYLIDSGYNRRSKSHFETNYQQKQLVDELVSLFLLFDFYKFLRDNPYQDLSSNHHFGRTRDILIARDMLKYV